MIFVTVGTHHQPFQRLLDGLSALDPAELVIQHGPGAPPPGAARAEAYMPFDEMLTCFHDANKVITHAGVGSILCARRAGHTPLVVPRRPDLGEHVDDHQVELTRVLEGHGGVIGVYDVSDLPEQLNRIPNAGGAGPHSSPGLLREVAKALRGDHSA